MENVKSVEDEILDKLIEKLKGDSQISPGVVSQLEKLRREGALGRADKLLEAYRQGMAAHDVN